MVVQLKNNKNQELFPKIDVDSIPANIISQVYYATIPASSWIGSDGWWYAPRVNCPELLSSDKCFFDLQKVWSADDGKSNNRSAIREAWGYVDSVWNGDGYFDIYATEKPEVDIPVVILCIRK